MRVELQSATGKKADPVDIPVTITAAEAAKGEAR